jgi:hypothetical protein
MQRLAVLREPDFNRPHRCDVRHAQVTVLFTFPTCASRYQQWVSQPAGWNPVMLFR